MLGYIHVDVPKISEIFQHLFNPEKSVIIIKVLVRLICYPVMASFLFRACDNIVCHSSRRLTFYLVFPFYMIFESFSLLDEGFLSRTFGF